MAAPYDGAMTPEHLGAPAPASLGLMAIITLVGVGVLTGRKD